MKFANRDRGFWAMTNQGSRLNTIAFRREAATSMVSTSYFMKKMKAGALNAANAIECWGPNPCVLSLCGN